MTQGRIALVYPPPYLSLESLPNYVVLDRESLGQGIAPSGKSSLRDLGSVPGAAQAIPRSIGSPWAGLDQVSHDWRTWISIYSRWTDRGDRLNLWVSQIAAKVLGISSALRSQNVRIGVFFTGVSHHVDSLLVQEAMRLLGIPQVHLYSVVISGRLLPLIQYQGIEDRRPLGFEISDHPASDDIDLFARAGASAPTFAQHSRSTSAVRAKLAFQALTRAVFHSLGEDGGVEGNTYLRDGTYGIGTYLRQARSWRKAMRTLARFEMEDESDVAELGDAAGLLIVAHYQPEATTYAEAGVGSSHLDLVAALRAHGWTGPIVYREHPGQRASRVFSKHVASFRDSQYYESLRDLGCIFMRSDQELDDHKLAQRALTPVTMTGSVALERSLRGNTTLVTGFPWFRDLPGTHNPFPNLQRSWPRYPNESIASEARMFLARTLSNRTLVNAPGIGTGVSLDTEAWRVFNEELIELMNQLNETYVS